MRARLVLLVLALFAVGLTSCSETAAPTAPAEIHSTPKGPSSRTEYPGPDGTCRSGYSVATGRDGELICVPDQGTQAIPRSLPDTI